MNRPCWFALVSLLCFSLLLPSAVQAESDQELLELIRDSHRAARESIRTCSCQVKFTIQIAQGGSKVPVTESSSSRYWLSRDAMRAKISENNESSDYLWEDSVRKSVSRRILGSQTGASARKRRYSYRHDMRCDPFVSGLLVLNLPSTLDYLPFEVLVERATKVEKVERKRVANKELITVQLFFDNPKNKVLTANVDIYLDPAVNYLVRKVSYSYSTHRWEEEVPEFKEYEPGLFFPEQVVGHSQLLPSKAEHYNSKTEFTDVQINQPLPKDIFNLKYPHGVTLSDDILGCIYQVDANGNQISKQTPFAREPPAPVKFGEGRGFGTETQEEPKSASRWILPFSLVILVVAGVLAFVRWQRKRSVPI